jgi:integrase
MYVSSLGLKLVLKLVKRHGSLNFYLRGTVRGISVDESTGVNFRNRKAAEEIKAKREAELLERSIHGDRSIANFAQAALSYTESGGEAKFLKPIIKHFGTMKLARIGQAEIDTAARKLYPTQAASTLNRQAYTPISAILRHAAKRGWCNPLILERPDDPPPRVRWITTEEANRLIDECSSWLRPLVIFLLYTGARCGEALWLDWRNIDLNRRHVDFINTKNGESRGVPLHTRIVEVLRGANQRDGYVFTKRDGTPYRILDAEDLNDVSAGDRIKKGFAGAVRRAELSDFHPHDCRHTWATWHYRANRDLGALQKLGGWKTLSMVMRYAHTNVAELDRTIDSIP